MIKMNLSISTFTEMIREVGVGVGGEEGVGGFTWEDWDSYIQLVREVEPPWYYWKVAVV